MGPVHSLDHDRSYFIRFSGASLFSLNKELSTEIVCTHRIHIYQNIQTEICMQSKHTSTQCAVYGKWYDKVVHYFPKKQHIIITYKLHQLNIHLMVNKDLHTTSS